MLFFHFNRKRAKAFMRFWRMYRTNKFGMTGLFILVVFVFMALYADSVAWALGYNFKETAAAIASIGTIEPKALLAALIFGSRISLTVGMVASVCAVGLGTLVGIAAGYLGGMVDEVLMRITDFIMMLPRLPLLIVIAAVVGKGAAIGLHNLILVIALLGWTGTARVVRAQTLSLKVRAFVEAARAVGASDRYILLRHILPNVMPLVFTYMVLGVPGAILAEANLTFLGLGVKVEENISWGAILYWSHQLGATLYTTMPWVVIPPGLCITFLTFSTVLIGYAMDEILNPRLRAR